MSIFTRVRALGLPSGEYVVFGSGPLEAFGLRESRDVDLYVSAALFEELASHDWEIKHWDDGEAYLYKDGVEIVRSWDYGSYSVSFEDLRARAVLVNGLPFAPLDDVLAWKKAFGREKDLSDVRLIEGGE